MKKAKSYFIDRCRNSFNAQDVSQAITYDAKDFGDDYHRVLVASNGSRASTFDIEERSRQHQRITSMLSIMDEDGAGAHGVFAAIKWAREQFFEERIGHKAIPVNAETWMPETTMQKMARAWLDQNWSS